MGRKNRNARSYRGGQTYTSFQAFKEPVVHFDLSTGVFHQKTRNKSETRGDIYISIVNNGPAADKRKSLNFSVAAEIGKKWGSYINVGIVKNDCFERLYIIKTGKADGYKVSASHSTDKRLYIKISMKTEELSMYDRYRGDHKVQYDADNNAYYITADK